MDSPDEKKQPAIEIRTLDAQGHPTSKVSRKYHMPSHSHLMVSDGETVFAGDVLAKIPRETTKTKDITGGLPRVVELFEARKPRETAVISEIDGIVKHGAVVKGQRKIMIVPDEPGAEPREYSLPRGVHVNVQEGERVRAGEPLMDGPSNPHDILNVLGEKELQKYLVNEIQEVYRLQGVNINDKHIEVISRQMMRWVKIEDVGDTEFLIDEQVDKFRFLEENERVLSTSGRPATGRPLLLGITKASLSTDSFISAASFQETTRVLTEASISGRIDYLRGLKENVTMGRLIPAGTGLRVLPRREDPGGRAAAAAGSAAADRGRSRAGSGDGVPHRAGRGAGWRRDDRITKNENRIKHVGRVLLVHRSLWRRWRTRLSFCTRHISPQRRRGAKAQSSEGQSSSRTKRPWGFSLHGFVDQDSRGHSRCCALSVCEHVGRSRPKALQLTPGAFSGSPVC